MEIDELAAAAGWPKTKYAQLERERRWLCDGIPKDLVESSSAICDLYLENTKLRLRKLENLASGEVQYKLTRKADLSATTRILTTIYISEPEYALLSVLPGGRVAKTRHLVVGEDDIPIAIDEFAGDASGLIMAEVEFAEDADMAAYTPPEFVGREVTDDSRYAGGAIALHGLGPQTGDGGSK